MTPGERLIEQGKAISLEEGREQGKLQGARESAMRTLRTILDRRGMEISEAIESTPIPRRSSWRVENRSAPAQYTTPNVKRLIVGAVGARDAEGALRAILSEAFVARVDLLEDC